MQQKQFQREVYSNTILLQGTIKTLNRQPNFTPKATGKRRREKPQNQQKERNQKDRDRNKKEMNEAILKINQTKNWFFEKIKLTNL